MKRLAVAILLLVGELTASGCGSHPSLGMVSGTVTFKGHPLDRGAIVFEVAGSRPATGKVVAGRICEVTTFEPNDGVPQGTARIAVFATQARAEESRTNETETSARPPLGLPRDYMGMNQKPLIPLRYSDPASSGLSCKIAKGTNVIQLDLTD
jgi:hypothetical protein